jgi:tryptophan 2,3-dioxygenase
MLSYTAVKGAILINIYRDEPIFQMPFQLITSLLDIDDLLTRWRNRHATMVQRMLGMKIGTGGSSGYRYLKSTATHHRSFEAFANLSMFLVPRSLRPDLPSNIIQRLRFHYAETAADSTTESTQ